MHELDDITGLIVDSAYKIHSRLGPGLLESAYEKMLVSKLRAAGLRVEQQKTVSFELD